MLSPRTTQAIASTVSAAEPPVIQTLRLRKYAKQACQNRAGQHTLGAAMKGFRVEVPRVQGTGVCEQARTSFPRTALGQRAHTSASPYPHARQAGNACGESKNLEGISALRASDSPMLSTSTTREPPSSSGAAPISQNSLEKRQPPRVGRAILRAFRLSPFGGRASHGGFHHRSF